MRIGIGAILLFSGFEKLTHPYENFLYAIQSYEIIRAPLDEWVARILPWLEFLTGLFVVVGLWTEYALKAAVCFFLMFIVVVGQAIVRALPVGDCGCFGEAIHLPLPVVLCMDTALTVVTLFLIRKHAKVTAFSLDSLFTKS